MRGQSNSLLAILLVVIALGGFGAALWSNSRSEPELIVIVPTEARPTENVDAWETILEEGFGENSTPLPTIAIPTAPFVPPTLERSDDTGVIPIDAVSVDAGLLPTFTPFNIAVTPTLPPPTSAVLATDVPVTAQVVTRSPEEWQPPPLIPPISRDPLGRDHYWLTRPVDSNAQNYGLFYYPFGSDGTEENPWRVHHGIDMSNPVGETVRAAGSGTVIWAADGLRVEGGVFQNTLSYGNVVVIEHDFGYRGQPLYTLYAHLSAALTERGRYVNAGDVIGLVGETGRVSGPHVHFEVRLGENAYANTYNPALWMVPYVGTGVIAGRVVDGYGNIVSDSDVTIKNWATGLVAQTTTTYVILDTGFDVRSDPAWQENFVVADIPVGRYEVIANINGTRYSKIIDVTEGTTSFVEISPIDPATPQAAVLNAATDPPATP
jgi:murein DD-endopeptidase MepM/ murein hydrolase activator NlpD